MAKITRQLQTVSEARPQREDQLHSVIQVRLQKSLPDETDTELIFDMHAEDLWIFVKRLLRS